jgi:hypothetical protein
VLHDLNITKLFQYILFYYDRFFARECHTWMSTNFPSDALTGTKVMTRQYTLWTTCYLEIYIIFNVFCPMISNITYGTRKTIFNDVFSFMFSIYA